MHEFEDFETELLFEQLSREDNEDQFIKESIVEEIIEEENIDTKELGFKGKKNNYRNIMITGSGMSKHPGRMKISKFGERVNRNPDNKNISIFVKKDNKIEYEGNLKDIDMSKSELEEYKNLYIRNKNLIQLIKDGQEKYDNYIDRALIKDEQLRNEGKTVIRDKEGNVEVHEKEKLLYKMNIKGDII